MFAYPDTIANTGKFGVNTMVSLTNSAIDRVESLAVLNLSTARSLLESSAAGVQAHIGARNPEELMGLLNRLALPTLKKSVSYSRSVYELSAQTQEEFADVIEAQFTEANRYAIYALDKMSKITPEGSDVGIGAFKSAIAAANSVYGNVNLAVKQFTEINEANAAAMLDATVLGFDRFWRLKSG